MAKPLVSICCLTYNHENYIRECLDGFISQVTDFKFEVLIHDDASNDNTTAIIREYERNYPEIIKPIYQKENQYSQGVKPTFKFNLPRARGKYIATCEGDDYWTDPFKLQNQVSFLENNPDYTITVGGYIFNNDGEKEEIILSGLVDAKMESSAGFTFCLKDTTDKWLTKTLTAVFVNRRDILGELTKYKYGRDVHLFYHLLKEGKGYYFKNIMGVYNAHGGGVHSSLNHEEFLIKSEKIYQELYEINRDEASRRMYFLSKLKLFNFRFRSKGISLPSQLGLFLKSLYLAKLPREGKDLILSFLTKEEVRTIKKYLGATGFTNLKRS